MSKPSLDLSRVKFTPEELRECYIDKRMNQREIAKCFHVDVRKIRWALQKWNIPIRPGHAPIELLRTYGTCHKGTKRGPRPFSVSHYPFTEEELHQCYVDREMSDYDIAKHYKISIWRVRYALGTIGLDTQSQRRPYRVGEALSPLDRHYDDYKRNAFLRKRIFNLSREHFEELVTRPCFYCGIPSSKKLVDQYFNGIDRIDNKLGYIEGNVRPCCGMCNRAKGRCTEKEFTSWIIRTANHYKATHPMEMATGGQL